jgi:aspartate kinase
MIVKKFGGSSIGSPQRIKNVLNLIKSDLSSSDKFLIVLSAIGGVTDLLEQIIHSKSNIQTHIDKLQSLYFDFIKELFDDKIFRNMAYDYVNNSNLEIIKAKQNNLENEILAQGELISTYFFKLICESENQNAILLNALEILKLENEDQVNLKALNKSLKDNFKSEVELFIIQGFICRDSFNNISNLKRGGSDYSASLFGAALMAEKIEIWSDIDGVHNSDPRFVDNTKAISELTYDEAAEMAYFGAKVLHPSTLLPARDKNIPVFLKNTLKPEKKGTIIHSFEAEKGIRAIAAKDNISVIRIKSDRMLLAYGFLSKIFEIFSKYKTPIDMITTSEVAVAVTIDDNGNLNNILKELKTFGSIEVDENQCIVSVIGRMEKSDSGYGKKVFDALSNIPISMISYGASEHNVSILINSEDKIESLRSLHSFLLT